MSRLLRPRQRFTATARRVRPSLRGTSAASAAAETNVSDVEPRARPSAANIGRYSTGWGIGIAHGRVPDHATLHDQLGLHAEERGLPDDEVRELSDLDRADVLREAVRNGGVDRVFR